MAWLAVNKDGTEWIMPGKPVRGWCGHWEYSEKVYVESEQGYVSIEIELPKGSVYKLLGKELTCLTFNKRIVYTQKHRR